VVAIMCLRNFNLEIRNSRSGFIKKRKFVNTSKGGIFLSLTIILMHKYERIDNTGSFFCIEGAFNVRSDGMIFRVFFCQWCKGIIKK